MATAVSTAIANDGSVGLALWLIFFHQQNKTKQTFLPTQRLAAVPRQSDDISELHILRGFIISCRNDHESIRQFTACLQY